MDSSSAALCWLLAHLASGFPRLWAAQYQGSQHHARTHPLSVPVPGCLQPGTGKAWIGSPLALLQRVQLAFPRATTKGNTWRAFQHSALQVCIQVPGSRQEP